MLTKLLSRCRFLFTLNLNTLRFNFKYFNFKTAIKFPVKVSSNVYLKNMSGSIILDFEWNTNSIMLGYGEVGVFDKKKSRSIWELNTGTVIFKGTADLGHGFKISVNNGTIYFGDNFKISAESSLICKDAEIKFGNNNLLSWDVIVMTSDFHIIVNKGGQQSNKAKDISLGDNVWVGLRTTILKGTTIPNGCILAANSVVTKEFINSNTIIGGNPAKEIKNEVYWN
jgi:acetyltransferase-like isoleucine patch superfamily enzyme